MPLTSSKPIWDLIEQHDSEDQKHFLQWQLQAREPIRRFCEIRPGDHLVRKGSFTNVSYEHHFLCIGLVKGKPKIIHYYNTARNASVQLIPTSLASGSNIEQMGIIREMILPHKDFIKSEEELQAEGKEVERVVWPEELRRYHHAEVANRALKRKDEPWYNLVKNNCETFVMWCLCDLQISLQVTSSIKTMCEAGSYLVKMLRQAAQQIFKAGVDIADDIIKPLSRNGLPKNVGLGVGAALSIFAECYMAYRDICKAKEKWKAGVVITSRKEFIKEVIVILVSASFRSVGSVIGMIAGQLLIPIPILGGIIGAVVGVFAGQFFATKLTDSAVTEWLAGRIDTLIEKRPKIAL